MPVSLRPTDSFADRHIGPRTSDVDAMLRVVGAVSLSSLVEETIPSSIRSKRPLELPAAITEQELLTRAAALADRNKVFVKGFLDRRCDYGVF